MYQNMEFKTKNMPRCNAQFLVADKDKNNEKLGVRKYNCYL